MKYFKNKVNKKIFLIILVSFFIYQHALADEPTIYGANDMTVYATSSAGSYVTFNVTASDTDATTITPSCSPSSGSLFSLGTTTVTCTATSTINSASSTSANFNLGVFLNFSSETNVDVPANCVATDTNNVAHSYEASSSSSYFGICALEAAVASSSISNVEFSNQYPSIGLFVTSINGIAADPSSQYWALYQNGSYASLGLAVLPVSASDTLVMELQDFSGDNLGDQVTLHINSLISTSTATSTTSISTPPTQQTQSSSGGSGGGSSVTHHNINVNNAIGFLEANENQDGSFGPVLYTDWAAIAFAASSENSYEDKIINYEKNVSPSNFSSATDYERHAMALEALGINPYTGTGTNYIQDIINDFDGTQIGDPNLINDDIFSIFSLIKAGYSSSDNIIQKVAANIISKQNTDGSWQESVDLTSAAIQALEMTPTISGASQAIAKARAYLVGEQNSDGGFGSSDSTSWALQAISAMGESGTNWLDGTNNPYDYLYDLQQSDGGIGATSLDMNTRIWSTEYAIPAALGKPWSLILNSFSKSAASNFGAEEVGVSESVVGAESAERTNELTPTSSAETVLPNKISSTTETEIGSLVRATLQTTRSPISVSSVPTTSSQAAAVVESQSTTTLPMSFETVAIAVGGSVFVIGGIFLLIFI